MSKDLEPKPLTVTDEMVEEAAFVVTSRNEFSSDWDEMDESVRVHWRRLMREALEVALNSAHAQTDIPKLIAEVEQLRAQVERVCELLNADHFTPVGDCGSFGLIDINDVLEALEGKEK